MIFKVDEGETGLSVTGFLQRRIPAAPAGYLRQLLKKGKVTRCGEVLSGEERLETGDEVRLPASARLQQLLSIVVPADDEPTVLYESREILVVDKPSGLAVHSSQGHERENLTGRVAAMLARRGDRFCVASVHRLDLETSGPVLFGKGKRACSELGKMFMRREVDKYYLALVSGRTGGSGVIRCDMTAKGKRKHAVTEFRACERCPQASLLELRLVTGRQHQIRNQLARMGHPIFGDRRYGGPHPDGLPRMFLHCHRVSFIDPYSGAQLDIASELPQDLAEFSRQVLKG